MSRPVLVVSHEASRTGAPRVAVEVLHALGAAELRCVAVLRWPGPMAGEFAAAAASVRLEPLRRGRALLRRWPRTRRVADIVEQVVAGAVLLRYRPRLVYLNTVKSACYVRPARLLRRPVVLHVHESEPDASRVLRRYRLGPHYAAIRLVACSTEVGASLSAATGVPAERITVIPSMVDTERIGALAGRPDGGRPPAGGPGTVVVGACGLANAGKGVDRWLEMAGLAAAGAGELEDRLVFVWVGRRDMAGLDDAVRRLGLEDSVRFTGELANPYPELARFDVFTHPARQDSFPLVVLEAMALARPVVAFDVGGVRSQVGDAGVMVPAGDAAAMAAAVVSLAGDPAARRALGERAAARVTAEFSIAGLHEAVRAVVLGPVGARARG